MTNKSVHRPGNHFVYATGTLIASCIMFIRVVIISGFYNPAILTTILIPATIMFLTMSGAAYYFYWRAKQSEQQTGNVFTRWFSHTDTEEAQEEGKYESPFQLIPAMKFAGVVVVIKFLA